MLPAAVYDCIQLQQQEYQRSPKVLKHVMAGELSEIGHWSCA